MSGFNLFWQVPVLCRWMLFAAFVFNLGFYMLIPFLAGYLKQDLLLSASLVGIVLGVRSFCQQGLFLVGGLLADLYGVRAPIVVGCLLRALGFGLFLFSQYTPLLFLAAFLTGFAGALFTPAAQAFFSQQASLSRAQMFSLVGVARNAGELLGPVVGVLLLALNFEVLCVIAALPFAGFAVVFQFLLPSKVDRSRPLGGRASEQSGSSLKTTLRSVFSNKAFLLFSLTMVGYFMLINQISFAIPLYLIEQDKAPAEIAWVMVLCALVAIMLQLPVTQFCERYLSAQYWISIGIALMGLSFLVLIPNWDFGNGLVAFFPLSTLACIFTLGTLVSFPFIMSQISVLAKDQAVASHFGFFYLFAGIGLFLGSTIVGWIFDLAVLNQHFAWYSLAVIGVSTAVLNLFLLAPEKQSNPTCYNKSSI